MPPDPSATQQSRCHDACVRCASAGDLPSSRADEPNWTLTPTVRSTRRPAHAHGGLRATPWGTISDRPSHRSSRPRPGSLATRAVGRSESLSAARGLPAGPPSRVQLQVHGVGCPWPAPRLACAPKAMNGGLPRSPTMHANRSGTARAFCMPPDRDARVADSSAWLQGRGQDRPVPVIVDRGEKKALLRSA